MMRVLWILNGCGLEGRGITGAPVRFHEISRRWQRQGIEQTVMTTAGGSEMLATLGSAIPRRQVAASLWLRCEPCRAFRFWSYLISSRAWRRSDWSAADVIITVSDYFCDVVPAMALKRRFGAKWIAWTHHRELGPRRHPGNRMVAELTYRMQERSYRRMVRSADAVWTLDSPGGEESAMRLKELGLPESRLRRMANGFDVKGIAATPEAEPRQYDAVMVGVRPDKGMADILPVWQRVQELRPGTTLLLMGGMSGEARLLEEIRQRGWEKIIRVFRPESGFVTGREYWTKLKSARIMFAPSPKEGWGIAVGEAMAAGLPVVAYDLPAYRKIYPDAYAAVPCFDRETFARQIVKALDDSAHAGELRRRGLAVASRYDWDAIAAADAAALA